VRCANSVLAYFPTELRSGVATPTVR